MNKPNRFLIAMIFSVLATLCFIAGQPRFAFLSPEIAKFTAIGLTMIAGVFWAFFGFAQRSD